MTQELPTLDLVESIETLHVGFTGTQLGITGKQCRSLEDEFCRIARMATGVPSGVHLHHGDCIGSDEEAHLIACELGWKTEIHPPEDDSKRAFCEGDIIHEPKPYLVRNENIVKASRILVATPKSYKEEQRSGTWSTIRMARVRVGVVDVRIIYPDGDIVGEWTEEGRRRQ